MNDTQVVTEKRALTYSEFMARPTDQPFDKNFMDALVDNAVDTLSKYNIRTLPLDEANKINEMFDNINVVNYYLRHYDEEITCSTAKAITDYVGLLTKRITELGGHYESPLGIVG